MFIEGLKLREHFTNEGIVVSLEGDVYLALEVSSSGEELSRSSSTFKCLYLAKKRLRDNGIKNINVQQVNCYNEMIGLE